MGITHGHVPTVARSRGSNSAPIAQPHRWAGGLCLQLRRDSDAEPNPLDDCPGLLLQFSDEDAGKEHEPPRIRTLANGRRPRTIDVGALLQDAIKRGELASSAIDFGPARSSRSLFRKTPVTPGPVLNERLGDFALIHLRRSVRSHKRSNRLGTWRLTARDILLRRTCSTRRATLFWWKRCLDIAA
jgi:hypothetical protein